MEVYIRLSIINSQLTGLEIQVFYTATPMQLVEKKWRWEGRIQPNLSV